MKINNNGFTLIELLAVIVILLLISVIAISSISAAMERNKVKQDNAKKDAIVSYGKLYYNEHKNTLSNKNVACISLSSLDLSSSEKFDSNNKEFTGYVKCKKISTGVTCEYVNTCIES